MRQAVSGIEVRGQSSYLLPLTSYLFKNNNYGKET